MRILNPFIFTGYLLYAMVMAILAYSFYNVANKLDSRLHSTPITNFHDHRL